MIQGANSLVTLDEIFLEFNQEDIFEYCGLKVVFNAGVKNPFRKDSDPGCHFDWFQGYILFHDFTGFFGKTGINCVSLVQFLHPHLKTNKDVLDHLRKNLTASKTPSKYIAPDKINEIDIRILSKPFSKKHYLNMFPPEFLYSQNTHYVDKYWCTTKTDPISKVNRFHNPKIFDTYAFFFPETKHIKLYTPELDRVKFYTNCTDSDIWGIDKIHKPRSKFLVVTKGGKDYLTLTYALDDSFDVIAVQSEYDTLDINLIKVIQKNYEKAFIVFDPDETGIKRMHIWEDQGFIPIKYNPQIGDSFDYMKRFGFDFLHNLMVAYV